ncbi:UNVERIFIED_CONTAM: hypothetical protein FKN15_057508 [Acipenser sinensis]
MDNFKARFDDFALERQLQLFIQNPFLVTNVTEFSEEAKQTFRWVNVASLQIELIELQENVALKVQVDDCDPVTFWGKMVPAAVFPVLNNMALHILTMSGSTYCSVRAFQRKLEIFKTDLQGELVHFPKLLEQTQREKDVPHHADFIQKLMDNFKARFDDFALERQLQLFIQNPFLVTNVTEFSEEAKQTFRWVNVASLQIELIELQENVALKVQVDDCDPVTFWGKMVPAAVFPVLNNMALHILTMSGSTYCYYN